MSKLSIIIPCYNCEKTLEEAVASCYTQGIPNDTFEIVMIDDKSTDNTRAVMQRLADTYDNINLSFHQKNRGGGATRNTAVAHSTGDVIFCLDSDDLLPPGTLAKMWQYLKAKKCDGVAFHHSVKFKKKNTEDIAYVDTFSYAGEKIPFESLLASNNACPLYVVFMFTKEAFTKADGYPESHGFDTQGFAWRFLSAGLIAYTCPETTYLHRVNFKQSYYLREAENGMVNFNWQKILLEHEPLLSEKAIRFVSEFNCADFTRNIFDELKTQKHILKENYRELLGRGALKGSGNAHSIPPIKRNSVRGLFMRIQSRAKKNSMLYSLARFVRRTFLKSPLIYLLSFSSRPLSDFYGLDRGKPIDRFYIETFLEENQKCIQGTCLELLNDTYTKQYGKNKVVRSDVLDIDTSNKQATIFGDLRSLIATKSDYYDCIILTQVLQFIDDVDAAIAECYRILKPGGVLLATLPTISRIDCIAGTDGDFWRFTTASAKYIFGKQFSKKNIRVDSHGNVRIGLYFYAGLAQEDTPRRLFSQDNPDFPTIITVKAQK